MDPIDFTPLPGWAPADYYHGEGRWWFKDVGPFRMLAGIPTPLKPDPARIQVPTWIVGNHRQELPVGTTVRDAMLAARAEMARQLRELRVVLDSLPAEG